jgi:hypothetical protein
MDRHTVHLPARMRAIQIGGFAIRKREMSMRAPMDERLSERVRELQCWVAEIAAAPRGEMPYLKGELEKRLQYEERLHRLQDIKEELSYLLRRAA